MHRQQPSKLQMSALQLADKLSSLADINEAILDPRAGAFIWCLRIHSLPVATYQRPWGQSGGQQGDQRRGQIGDSRRIDFKYALVSYKPDCDCSRRDFNNFDNNRRGGNQAPRGYIQRSQQPARTTDRRPQATANA
jgi:hypothetical protein